MHQHDDQSVLVFPPKSSEWDLPGTAVAHPVGAWEPYEKNCHHLSAVRMVGHDSSPELDHLYCVCRSCTTSRNRRLGSTGDDLSVDDVSDLSTIYLSNVLERCS